MSTPEVHFVVGAPRSGSTWLAAALNGHPDIFATEQRLFGPFCEMWPNNDGKMAPRITFDSYARAVSVHYFHQQLSPSREEFLDDFTRDYIKFLSEFGQRRTGKRILIDKVTPYSGTAATGVDQIQKYFPTAKIFQLVRDGRDVVTSGTFDWLLKDAQGTTRHQVFVEHNPSIELLRFFDDSVLTRWAEHWREMIALFDAVNADLTIRYEDMLDDQAPVLADLFTKLNVDSSDEVANGCRDRATFEKMTGRARGQEHPTKKQRSGTSGGWKKYFTRRDGELFHSIAGKQLIGAGYESDDSWLEKLPLTLSADVRPQPDGADRS